MIMRSPKSWWWVAAAAIALAITGVALSIWAGTRTAREQKFFCWDAPSSGPPAKYVGSFDGGMPFETTGECVRVPGELPAGEHVATVRAVNEDGQMSPTASLEFSIR
jgi:hypothetical protein